MYRTPYSMPDAAILFCDFLVLTDVLAWAGIRDSVVGVIEDLRAQRLAEEQVSLLENKFTCLREIVDEF